MFFHNIHLYIKLVTNILPQKQEDDEEISDEEEEQKNEDDESAYDGDNDED